MSARWAQAWLACLGWSRRLALCAVLAAGLWLPTSAVGAYQVVDLGPRFVPLSVGADGSVIGEDATAGSQLRRWKDGTSTLLPGLQRDGTHGAPAQHEHAIQMPRGVADDGSFGATVTVPQPSGPGFSRAVRVLADNTTVDLELPSGHELSQAVATNAGGTIVGRAVRLERQPNGTITYFEKPVIWDADNHVKDLPEPPNRPICQGVPCATIPVGIADNGAIVGLNQSAAGQLAVRWTTPTATPAFLNGLAVAATQPTDVGGNTTIGQSGIGTFGGTYGVYWTGTTISRLTSPGWNGDPANGGFSIPFDVNELGAVVGVGQASGTTGWTPWLFKDGVYQNVNTLLPPDSGWVLSTALAISNTGAIAGAGVHNNAVRGYMLIPDPGPTISATQRESGTLRGDEPPDTPIATVDVEARSASAIEGVCYAVQAERTPAPAAEGCSNLSGPRPPGQAFEGTLDLSTLRRSGQLKQGSNPVQFWVYASDGSSSSTTLEVEVGPNLFIEHLEVAQSLAPVARPSTVDPESPSAVTLSPPLEQPRLVASKPTWLRIYVGDPLHKQGDPSLWTVSTRVSASAGGTELPGEVERQIGYLVDGPSAIADRQKVRLFTSNVLLPPAWVREKEITLTVRINADRVTKECTGCIPRGRELRIGPVRFVGTQPLAVYPVPIVFRGSEPRGDNEPARLLDDADALLPISREDIVIRSGATPVASSAPVLVDMWERIERSITWDLVTGAVRPVPGERRRYLGYVSCPCGNVIGFGRGQLMLVNVALDRQSQTLPALAHELGHTLGLDHVRSAPGDTEPPPPLTALPYRGLGNMVGYGSLRLGTRASVLRGDADLIIRPDFFDGLPHTGEVWDIMSYAPDKWVTRHSWEAMLSGLQMPVIDRVPGLDESDRAGLVRSESAARARGPRTGPMTIVSGTVGPRGASIRSTVRVSGRIPSLESVAPDDLAGWIEARGTRGQLLASAPVGRLSDLRGPSPFVAVLPGAAPARIAVRLAPPGPGPVIARRRAGRIAASYVRSRDAPRVQLLKLPRSVRRRAGLTLRWRATDRDSRKLAATLLMRRGQGSWRLVASDLRVTKRRVEVRSVPKGTRIRFRVLVSDGLNTTAAVSRAIRVR